MSKPMDKIKALVETLKLKFRRQPATSMGDLKAVKKTKLDPIQKRLKMYMMMLIVFSWVGLGFLTKQLFFKSPSEIVSGADHKKSQENSHSTYSWTSGFSFGHDIVEQEVEEDRGLAAALDSRELKITVGVRYIEFRDIEAVVKTDMGNHSRVLLSITLEVDSYPAEQEVLAKEMKIREIVAAILATKEKGVLQNFQGVVGFKQELLKRLSLVIRTGRVTDVLITT